MVDSIREIPWGASRDLFAAAVKGGWRHFYPHPGVVEMTGHDPSTIHPVRVTVDPEGDYWGWWYSDHPANLGNAGRISMVWADRRAVEVCFPYGTEAEENLGRGRMVRLRVEQIEPDAEKT